MLHIICNCNCVDMREPGAGGTRLDAYAGNRRWSIILLAQHWASDHRSMLILIIFIMVHGWVNFTI